MTKTFPAEDLMDLLEGDTSKYDLIKRDFCEKKRWSLRYYLYFREKDQEEGYAWQTWYNTPATESTECDEFDDCDVVCHLVKSKEIKTITWERV